MQSIKSLRRKQDETGSQGLKGSQLLVLSALNFLLQLPESCVAYCVDLISENKLQGTISSLTTNYIQAQQGHSMINYTNTEVFGLMGYNGMRSGRKLSAFRKKMLPSIFRVNLGTNGSKAVPFLARTRAHSFSSHLSCQTSPSF